MTSKLRSLFFIILVYDAANIYSPCNSVKITRFVVPTTAPLGALLNLDCAYDLENLQLYGVNWYKDSNEFFRCKSNGDVQEYELEDIKIYHDRKAILGSCPVTVTILNIKSGGQYRCEVSTEAPEFRTTAQSVTLKVRNATSTQNDQDDADSNKISQENEKTMENNGTKGINTSSAANLLWTILMYLAFYL